MTKFNIHDWRHKQVIESYKIRLSDQNTIEILAEIYMANLSKNKLYENISPHQYHQLKEQILKKLNAKFSNFSSKLKKQIKNTISKIGKKGLSSLQKIASQFPTFNKSSDLLFRIKIANSLDKVEKFVRSVKSIKEGEEEDSYPPVSNTNEINKIKVESGFIWKGKSDSNYKYLNTEVNNGEDNPLGLISGMHYYVFPAMSYEDEKGNLQKSTPSIAGLGALKPEIEGESKGFLIDLNKWLTKYKLNYVFAALGILSVTGGVTAATGAAVSDYINVDSVTSHGGVNQGELTMAVDDIPDNFKADADNEIQGIETQDSPTTDSGGISKDLSQMGVDINIDITDDANTATEILTHDSGEYKISDTEKQAAAKSLTEKLLDDINKTLETKKGQNLESIDLTVNYGGSISYQGGEDSQKANDNTDLLKGRVQTSSDIVTIAIGDVERIIADAYGQEFVDNNLNIELNEVDTERGIENQTVQQTGDDLSTQSSFQSINIDDIKTGDTGEPITLLQYQFAAIIPDKPTPQPFVEPPIVTFTKLIREGQIAVIMGLIKPEVEIFPYLNAIRHDKNSNEVIGRYEQSDFKKVRDDDKVPQETRDLAKAIIIARQKPDMLPKKIAKILGITLSKRAKAKFKVSQGDRGLGRERPGFTPITEKLHLFTEILNEAAGIDQFLDSGNIKKNAGKILAYIGSMYASQDNKQVGIVDVGSLPDDIKNQLPKAGFEKETAGRDKGTYVFMDAGEKQSVSKGTPDKVSKPISLSTEPSEPLDQTAVKGGKVFTTPKDTPVFPPSFYKSTFYKKADREGWVFVNREDIPSLPKGTKVKTFNSTQLDNIDQFDFDLFKNTLKENKRK